MPIGNVVQRGSSIQIYNEKGMTIGTIGCSSRDELLGYTSHQINVRRGSTIISFNERGSMISTTAAPQPPPVRRSQDSQRPASSSSSSDSEDDAGSGLGVLLLVVGALAYGAYQHYWPKEKQSGEPVINAAPIAMANTESPPSASVSTVPDDRSLGRASAEPALELHGLTDHLDEPRSDTAEKDAQAETSNKAPAEPQSDQQIPSSLSSPSWATITNDVDLNDKRIQKAIDKALSSGAPVIWSFSGHKGYAVPSEIQSRNTDQCLNLSLTVFYKTSQIVGPPTLYCHDQSINTAWIKK